LKAGPKVGKCLANTPHIPQREEKKEKKERSMSTNREAKDLKKMKVPRLQGARALLVRKGAVSLPGRGTFSTLPTGSSHCATRTFAAGLGFLNL